MQEHVLTGKFKVTTQTFGTETGLSLTCFADNGEQKFYNTNCQK
jgi:hypothetical protein